MYIPFCLNSLQNSQIIECDPTISYEISCLYNAFFKTYGLSKASLWISLSLFALLQNVTCQTCFDTNSRLFLVFRQSRCHVRATFTQNVHFRHLQKLARLRHVPQPSILWINYVIEIDYRCILKRPLEHQCLWHLEDRRYYRVVKWLKHRSPKLAKKKYPKNQTFPAKQNRPKQLPQKLVQPQARNMRKLEVSVDFWLQDVG